MRRIALPVVVLLASLLPAPAARAEGKPIQLALFAPAQIVPEKESIAGLRISLLYGVNQDVTGVDWGLVSHVRGNGFAWQVGGVGIVEKNFQGWQDNWVNITQGEFTGFQSGVVNRVATGNGVQLGVVNLATSMHGLQFGILNMTRTLRGLQIGVGNVIETNKIPFLPIVNWTM